MSIKNINLNHKLQKGISKKPSHILKIKKDFNLSPHNASYYCGVTLVELVLVLLHLTTFNTFDLELCMIDGPQGGTFRAKILFRVKSLMLNSI